MESRDSGRVVTALADLLHLAQSSLRGIDPDHLKRSVIDLEGSSYTKVLIEHRSDSEGLAVWSYLELASFGGIISLYKYYVFDRHKKWGEEKTKPLLFPAKALRNTAAHNGNMLSTLGSKLKKPVGAISSMAINELGIERELVMLTRRAPIVHDFTALTLCYACLVKNEHARSDAAEKLQTLHGRFAAHADYFSKQGELDKGMKMLRAAMTSTARLLTLPAESEHQQ